MTASARTYLADLYRLEELESWRLLARHLALTDGFSFVVVLAPDDNAVAYLRSRLSELVGSPEAVRRVAFDPAAGAGSLAEALLKIAPLSDSVHLVWIDADPVEPDQIRARDEGWRNALARLNRFRNTLQARFRCTLALAGPVSLQSILREAAPDLWSIRSAVFRFEPAGSARALAQSDPRLTEERFDPERMGLPGDPAVTLAEAERIRGKPGREILLAQLLYRAGLQAFRMRKWDLALRCLQEANALEEAQGADPALRFNIAQSIAEVFRQLAQWDRALHYSRKALEVAETHFGTSHQATSAALNNLAQVLQAKNHLAEAEPLLRRALAIDEGSFGLAHSVVARDLNNLAVLLQAANHLAEAELPLRRALAIDERNFGPDHPAVGTDLNNLAALLHATNHLSEAEPLLRRALAIDERNFGRDHPKIAVRLNNLAGLLQATNRLAEAEPLLRRALAIDERNFGPDHPAVARDFNNLAQFLQATNRLAEAESLLRRALAINERSFGPDHPDVARNLNNLATLLHATNHLAEAEPLLRRALAIDEGNFGPDHPAVATNLNNLARVLQDTNRLAEAEPLLRRALAINERSVGPGHPDVATCLHNLAKLLQATNRLAEAESLSRRAIGIFLAFGQRTGRRHPNLSEEMETYEKILRNLGRTEAEIQAKIEMLKPEHP